MSQISRELKTLKFQGNKSIEIFTKIVCDKIYEWNFQSVHRLEAAACVWVIDDFFRNYHTILIKKRENTQLQAAASKRWKTVGVKNRILVIL